MKDKEERSKVMRFTYSWYKELLKKIKDSDYGMADFINWREYDKSIILRHDIDMNLASAVEIAKIEQKVLGTSNSATYFILVSTNFYNIFSKESRNYIQEIIKCGGEIGLHFDETQYGIFSEQDLVQQILKEKNILENVVEQEVKVVSMHRPSKKILSNEITLKGMINAYANTYLRDMKYVSDSRRNWREDIDNIISSGEYERVCILTHPIWYRESEDSLRKTIWRQIVQGAEDRCYALKNNISDFNSVVAEQELSGFWEELRERIDEKG